MTTLVTRTPEETERAGADLNAYVRKYVDISKGMLLTDDPEPIITNWKRGD